jgi:hypothetical protein
MNPTSGQGGLLGVRPTVVIPQQQLQDLAANSHAPLQLLQQAHGGLAVESDVPTKRQRINDLSVGSDVTVLLQLQDNLAVAGESVLSKEKRFKVSGSCSLIIGLKLLSPLLSIIWRGFGAKYFIHHVLA